MNDTHRGSLDDVLASIRKIVRAEKEEAVAAASDDGPDDRSHSRPDDDAPLVLTPEMRTDAAADAAADDDAANDPGEGSEVMVWPASTRPDGEALQAMLRELLRRELAGGAAEAMVREIIRDELTHGEIGNNVSQNVLRLIRAEVAKAVERH
jgi:hypothetical protein